MGDLLALMAVLLGGAFAVAPWVALYLVWDLRKRNAGLERQIRELEQRGARADWWIGELARRSEGARAAAQEQREEAGRAETQPSAEHGAAPEVAAVSSASTSPTMATSATTGIEGRVTRAIFSAAQSAGAKTAGEESVRPERAAFAQSARGTVEIGGRSGKAFDFETLVGVRLFAWLGGLGLFIGAAFFLEYSIEHDLISPPMRIGIGLVAGALAVLLGDIIRAKADRAGQALGGAGIATLYASLFAARTLYELIAAPATFAAMALVTAAAGVIAVRRDAFVLAVIGLVGGFATPVLLSTGEDHRYALFAYIGLLDAGVLFVAAKRRWLSLTVIAFVATGLIYGGWASEYLDREGAAFALGVAAALSALFALATLQRAPTIATTARTRVQSSVARVALASPFVAALTVATGPDLRVAVPLLSSYICLLLAGTFVLAKRWGAPLSLEIGASLGVLALVGRIAPDVLGDQRLRTLVAFSGPALVLSLLWLWQERRCDELSAKSLRRAAAITLGGSVVVATQALSFELPTDPIGPFAVYVAAHVAALAAIGLVSSSPRWLALAQALWIAALVTFGQRYEPTRLNEYLPFVLVPMLAFFALPLITSRARSESLGWIAAALSLVTHYAVLYGLARNVWLDFELGIGAVAAGALALGMLAFARPRVVSTHPSGVLAVLGAVTLAFLTAAVPITLSKQWITVAWGLEVTGLAWLYRRISHKGLIAASAVLASATAVRLVANPWLWEYHPRSGTIVLNWYLYTFGLPAVALFGAAHLLKSDPFARQYRYPAVLWFAGGAILFVLLNVEIADAYSTGQTIGFHMGASLGEDMTYSLGWGIFGLSTLVVGMLARSTPARLSALAVLLLAIAKVFLHDLWHLGALYRVGSMVGLAMALLAVSFLTQRFVLRGDRP